MPLGNDHQIRQRRGGCAQPRVVAGVARCKGLCFMGRYSELPNVPLPAARWIGESDLINMLLEGGPPEALQPLANCGRDVYVFHNEYLALPRPLIYPPASCSANGWGHESLRTVP